MIAYAHRTFAHLLNKNSIYIFPRHVSVDVVTSTSAALAQIIIETIRRHFRGAN